MSDMPEQSIKALMKKPSRDYWDEKGRYHLDGRVWLVAVNLAVVSQADSGEPQQETRLEAKVVSPAEGCPSFDNCSAPLCPLDKQSLEVGVWYPDEPICNKQGVKPHWVIIQRRIAKKVKDRTRYFTMKDLQGITNVRSPNGHNPDLNPRQEYPPSSKDGQLSRVGFKKAEVTGRGFSPSYSPGKQFGLWDSQKAKVKIAERTLRGEVS